MRLLISDTNILIDLEEGRLLEQFFQLPYDRMKANDRRLPWTLALKRLDELNVSQKL